MPTNEKPSTPGAPRARSYSPEDREKAEHRLKRAVALCEKILVDQRLREHTLERPPPVKLDRRLWRVTAYILRLAGALGRLEDPERGLAPIPWRIALVAGERLSAAARGFPSLGLTTKRGHVNSPYKQRAIECAVEYVELAKAGYLDDHGPVVTVRRIFREVKHNRPLSEKAWRAGWQARYRSTGRLRTRIEQAVRDGARGSPTEIAHALLEEYAVGLGVGRTGV